MPTISQQLNQLSQDRENLVDNLETMGIEDLTGNETFTQLVPQVLNISGGQYIQYDAIPEASSELNNSIIQYVGTTGNGYTNGYFYKCQESATPGTYEWININVQTEPESEHIQYSTMPEASASNVGKIVQYVGSTNANFTNGYYYKCIEDDSTPTSYIWETIGVEDKPYMEYMASKTGVFATNFDLDWATYKKVCKRFGRFVPIKWNLYHNSNPQGVYSCLIEPVLTTDGYLQGFSGICNYANDSSYLQGYATFHSNLSNTITAIDNIPDSGTVQIKVNHQDIPTITSVTGTLGGGQLAYINYPSGYTRDNCIVLAIASKHTVTTGYYNFYGSATFDVYFSAYLDSSQIIVNAQYVGTPDTTNRDVKVWLMKVS